MRPTVRLTGCACAAIVGWALWSADNPKVIRVDGRKMTLEAALKASRTAEPGAPRTIILRGGRYLLEAPLTLTPQDSNLTIESDRGQRAELCGGRRITGWRKDGSGPLWVADLPDFNLKPWRFRMLVVNGEIAQRARLPEQGFFRDDNPDFSVGGPTATDEQLTTLRYRAGDLGPWFDVKSAELRVYATWDASLSKIAWIDDSNRIARLSIPLRYPPGAFYVHKYEILNVREGLRAPGQWFLDYGTNRLYYWPLVGEDMTTAEVWAPVTEVLIQIAGSKAAPVSGVTLRNLDLTITDAPAKSTGFAGSGLNAAISANYSQGGVFSGLRIRQVGASGINGSSANQMRVLGCEFSETGASSIWTVGSDDTEIADSSFGFAGHASPDAAGMLLMGNRSHVHHNEVHDMPYSGIAIKGEFAIVEFNNVYRVMLLMADGAAIYATIGGGKTGGNGFIRSNWARDVGVGPASKAPAYYLDNNVTGYAVEHNVAAVANWLFFVHDATGNTVRENVFASSGDARTAFQAAKATVVERNVIFAPGKLTMEAAPEAIAAFRDNILFSGQGQMQLLQLDTNKVVPLDTSGNAVADPEFIDVTHGNLRFQPGSRAVQLGIPQPPTLAEVGPRRSAGIDRPSPGHGSQGPGRRAK